MSRHVQGFTLIELVIFIVATSVLMTGLFYAANTSLLNAPKTSQQVKANMLANQCMQWLYGYRRINGFNALPCPSSPTGTLCSSVTGYTITTSVICTTLNGDSNFKILQVVVTGNANATLETLIAGY